MQLRGVRCVVCEVLNDCVCRKCSMVATLEKLVQEVEKVKRLTAENANADGEKARNLRVGSAAYGRRGSLRAV